MFRNIIKPHIYIVVIFSLLKLSYSTAEAQILNRNQQDTIIKDLYNIINVDAYFTQLNNGFNNISIIGTDTFYNVNGFHLLYKINNNRAERIDRSYFHGHNFFRLFYSHDSSLFLLGGYGYFTTNNNLEVFDFNTREWQYVSTKGDKPEYIRGLNFKIGDSIYCINTTKSGNEAEPDITSDNIYILDLNSRKWKKTKNINKDIIGIDFHENYHTDDYVIGMSRKLNKLIIVNLKTKEYLLKSLFNFTLLGSHFDVVEARAKANSITIKFKVAVSKNSKYMTINIDDIYNKERKSFEKLVLLPSFTSLYFYELLIIPFSISLLTFIYFILRNKKQDKMLVQTDKQTLKYIESLKSYAKNSLTIEELDALFEIDHMENESKKSKRHRLLTTIKTNHPGFITRVKDENDKRRFVYLVDREYFNS